MEKLVDISKAKLKLRSVKRAFAVSAAKVILESAQEIYDRIGKNLEGPHYGVRTTRTGSQVAKRGPGTGKLPVPRITGNLSRSLTMTPLSSVVIAIWCDPRIAHYARYVALRKTQDFFYSVGNERRQAIQNRTRYQLLKAVRAEGLK